MTRAQRLALESSTIAPRLWLDRQVMTEQEKRRQEVIGVMPTHQYAQWMRDAPRSQPGSWLRWVGSLAAGAAFRRSHQRVETRRAP